MQYPKFERTRDYLQGLFLDPGKLIVMLRQEFLNALQRIQKAAQGSIMIQGINDVRQIFTHVTVDIVWFLQQFRSLINQVGGQYIIQKSCFICLDRKSVV